MPRFNYNRRLFVLLLSIILLTVVITFSIKRESASWPEKVIIDSFSWVQSVVYKPVGHIAGFIDEVEQILNLYEENTVLKEHLKDYQTLSARLTEAEQRNKQLETMLNFKGQPHGFNMWPANVTGRSTDKWNSSITIDKGSNDGVKKNMAIIAPDGGLVGRVLEVGISNSKVLLITDTNPAGISAIEQDTRAVGIVSGSTSEPGVVEMGLIDRDAKLAKGQKVVTSNLSSLFPPGIPIGEIVDFQMEDSGLTQKATIKPAANLDRLEMVFYVEHQSSGNGN